jgi:hypothetical protein
MAKPRAYQQIESTADFYSPGVYELLPRFSNFKAQADSLEGDYVPLTSVGVRPTQDAKMFVVGIMPPTSNVTGRLLDRSASIAALTGVATDYYGAVSEGGDPPSDAYYDELVITANRLGVDPLDLITIFYIESGNDPHRVGVGSRGSRAKGLNQMMEYTAEGEKVGMSKEDWDRYADMDGVEQLFWVGRSLSGCKGKDAGGIENQNLGSVHNKEGIIPAPGAAFLDPQTSDPSNAPQQSVKPPENLDSSYASAGWQARVKSAKPGFEFKRDKWQAGAYEENIGFDRARKGYITEYDVWVHASEQKAKINPALIDAAKKRVGNETEASIEGDVLKGQALKDSWAGKGSANAKKSQREQQKVANHDLNLSGLGQAMVEKQLAMIKATLAALEVMKNTPPLRMLVNPQSFKVSSEKIVSDSNRSRSQFIIEHWGEQQDKIEASGKIAGFYAADMADPTTVGTYPGLTRMARQFSKSWQNFLSLFMLYRSNGGLFIQDFYEASHSKDPDNFTDTILSVVGSIYIYYDNILYIGSFDSFGISESDTAPFTVEYNFSFSVRASFLLDFVDDPRFTYGAPRLFDPNTAIPTTTGTGQLGESAWVGQEEALSDAEAAANARNQASAQKCWDEEQAKNDAEEGVAPYDPLAGLEDADAHDTPWLDDKGKLKVPKGKNNAISPGKKNSGGSSSGPANPGWVY